MRNIAYCIDTLVPGIYLWWGNYCYKSSNINAESTYPGVIKDNKGFAIILPNYKIWTSYKKSLDNVYKNK
jgi:hypothetical protein